MIRPVKNTAWKNKATMTYLIAGLRPMALLFLLGAGIFTSCISPKTIVYFQDGTELDTLSFDRQTITETYTPIIQPKDLLSIVVGSLNAEANEVFNVANQATVASVNYNATGGGARLQPVGYLVDAEGKIELPLAGKILVSGLTTSAAADTIRVRLGRYLKEATVTVRNVNFKISVLGEVNRPAVYIIPDENITIPEAVSLAGDLTIFGRRNNITIIRQENGERTLARIDLTSRDIFSSPYYYLHKNDVLYVEPVRARMTSTDRTMQILPLVLSSISVIAIVLTRVF